MTEPTTCGIVLRADRARRATGRSTPARQCSGRPTEPTQIEEIDLNTHTHLLADRIAANHHNGLIRSAAQRTSAANRDLTSDRPRIARPFVAARRGVLAAAASTSPALSRSGLSTWQR